MKPVLILLGALCLALSACRDEETARRVLGANGFHDIQITDDNFWFSGCAQDNTYSTRFRAVSTGGQIVTGVVCSGPGKGATLRFD